MRKRSIKNSFLEFHFSYLLIAVGYILCGQYLSLIAFSFLVLIHELGHCLMAILFHVKISKVIIYPFGGMTKLKCFVNFSIFKELLIALFGVVFQSFGFLFICFLYKYNFIREYTLNIFSFYHFRMLFFNLLPIYPLDGGKIWQLILQIVFPFRVANMVCVICSLIVICSLFIFHVYVVSYSNVIIFLILFYFLIDFYFKFNYLYSRFLLERYLYCFYFSKIKVIDCYKNMYKGRLHFIRIGNCLIKEKDFLGIYFNKKR